MLVLVVGPSGAGKDTLLDGARRALASAPEARSPEERSPEARFPKARSPGIRFVRRVITRPADAGGEDHEAVTEAAFLHREFALQWSAHGLRYGIPADIASDLALGVTVVANVSRGVIAEAATRFPVRVIAVTASPDVLAARLAARGRESAADVAARLGRVVAVPDGVEVTTVVNDGSVAEGVSRFVQALRR